MWRYIFLAVASAPVVVMASLGAPQPTGSPNEIVIADPVRIAFYEPAPRAIARSMQYAVDQSCGIYASRGRQVAVSGVRSDPWYCSEVSLRFLRAVNLRGHRYKVGFACDEESVTPNLRFYTEDMFSSEEDDFHCIFVAYDDKTKRHIVEDQ